MSALFPKTKAVGMFALVMSLIAPQVNAASLPMRVAPQQLPFEMGAPEAETAMTLINHRRDHRGHGRGRVHRDRDHGWGNHGHRPRRVDRAPHVHRDFDRPRYRGSYRGSRFHRNGYRRGDDGWWYPLAAFALGAVILNQQRVAPAPVPRQSYTNSYSNWDHIPAGNLSAHDAWCDRQYRSYDRGSKTFQPYNGPRRYCNSPYDRL